MKNERQNKITKQIDSKSKSGSQNFDLAIGHMQTEIISISDEDSVEQALMVMKNHDFRHLPVLNKNTNEIIGIVSDRDLYQALSSEDVVVGQVVNKKPVFKYDTQTPISEIVATMIREKISAVLLTKDNVVKGIITTEDLLIMLSQALSEDAKNKSFMDSYLEYTNQITGAVFNPNLIT